MPMIQVWSAPSCEAGAICYGALFDVQSATGTEATGTPAAFRIVTTRAAARMTSLDEGRCLRVRSQSRGEQWWFVSQVTDGDGDTVQVTAGPIQQLLTIRGLVRDGTTFQFAPGRQTVQSLLDTYIFTNLATDQLSWLALGTIDFADTIEIGSLDRVTRGGVLALIERETGHTLRLRPFYIGGALAAFRLDIVDDLGEGLDPAPLTAGVHPTSVQRTRDALRAATVVVPFSAGVDTMDLTQWVVQTFTPGTPAWIPLADPVAGQPGPIREDGQLIGARFVKPDGSDMPVLDSRASDSAVQIASSGGLSVGDRITFARDTDGNPVFELTSPSGVNGSRGRLVATVSTRLTDVRRNYCANGAMTRTSAGSMVDWTGTKAYPRDTAQTWSATLGATLSSGVTYTAISYTGATPGTIVQPYEVIRINAGGSTQNVTANLSDIHIVDGTGAGTIAIFSWAAPATYVGNSLNLYSNALGLAVSERRPASFPSGDAGTSVASVAGTAVSLSAYAFYTAAMPYVRAAFATSVKTDASGATSTSGERPSCKIYDPDAAVTLATTTYGSNFTNSQEAHFTMTLGVSLASSRRIRAEFTAGALQKMATYLRYCSLWLDDSLATDAMGPQSDSASNLLWHRAQDVLTQQGTGTRYVVRGVDLALLSQSTTALALGQRVRLREPLLDVDVEVTVVKLDYVLDQQEVLNLELGTLTPRLTGVTVTL